MYDESFDFESAENSYMFFNEPSTSLEDSYEYYGRKKIELIENIYCRRCNRLLKRQKEYCPYCGLATYSYIKR